MTEHDEFEKWYADRTMKDVADTDLFGNLARQAFQAGRAHERASFAEECVRELEMIWKRENEVYKKSPSSYNEGWVDGVDEMIGVIKRLTQERGGK